MLDKFIGAKIEITKHGCSTKGIISIKSGAVIELDMSLDQTVLDDYWKGFFYEGNEYDINIWSNDSFGGKSESGYSACVYQVDENGSTDTSYSVPVIVTKVEEE